MHRSRLSIVSRTLDVAGTPQVRVTRGMPESMTPDAVLREAKLRARKNPRQRVQVLEVRDEAAPPRVLWDSHPPN